MNIKEKIRTLKIFRVIVQIIFFILMPSLFSQAFAGVKEAVALIGKGENIILSDFVIKLLILCTATIVIWEDILWICLLIRCCWRLVLYVLRIYSEKDGKKITCHTVKMADSLAKIKIYRADLCHWILLFGKRGICHKIQSVDGIFSYNEQKL